MAKKKKSTNLADDTLVLADVITDEKPVGTNGLQHALEYIKENFVTQDEFNYKAIVINSFTNNKNTVEIGSTVTDILLSWSLNKKAKVLTLDDESLEPTDTSKQLLEQNIKTNKTWTLKAEDEKGAVSTKTTSLSFLNGIYWGASSSQDTYDNTFVLGLTKALQGSKGKVFTVNAGEGQFIFYAVPTRYGDVSFNVGGFDGGFSKVATIEFTNASGYKENYDIYKSDNANLGNTTVTAK